MPNLVPSSVVAVALGVSPAMVRKLRQRGQLTRYGTTSRAEYDLDEVRELATRRLARPIVDTASDAVSRSATDGTGLP